MELHFIELAKFNKDKPRSLSSPFEKWLYAFKYGNLYQKESDMLPQELITEEGIEEALKAMRFANSDTQARYLIEARQKFLHDQASFNEDAREEGLERGERIGVKKGVKKGVKQGLKQGLKQGREEGIAQGITQGITQGKAESIINLALDGDLPIEKARKKVESLKELLPPDFYAQIIKKLN